jgi:hypothetical protein
VKRSSKIKATLRAVFVVSGITMAVSGVTFAALQSQQDTIKGNTIQTASANLQLSSDGTNFTNSLTGYAFNNIIPGGTVSPVPGYPVSLKNAGSTPLAIKLSIAKAVTNPDNVDLGKVHVILNPFSGGVGQNLTMQDLITSSNNGGIALTTNSRLLPGQTSGYTLQVMMEADAFSGPSASLSDIDFSFGATAVN